MWWHRRRHERLPKNDDVSDAVQSSNDAHHAKGVADCELAQIRGRGDRVDKLGRKLEHELQRNHFADAIRATMRRDSK